MSRHHTTRKSLDRDPIGGRSHRNRRPPTNGADIKTILLGLLLLAVVASGCRFAMPERKMKASVHAQKDVSASYNQIRLRIRSMVGPACGEIEQTADQIIVSGDVTKGRAFAKKWAREHPIHHSISDRESTLSRVLERDSSGSISTGQAVATVDRLTPALDRALGVLETAPKLIASEREAAIKAVQDEMTRTIKFVQEERVAALDRLTTERLAAVKDLQVTVVAERKALTQDLEQISLKVVDHAFWRAAQLLAAVLVLLAIGLVLAVIVFKRMRTQNP